MISRALCDLFTAPALAGKIAFRGGTAINKLLFRQPLRYSEDIDLVQTQPEPIGTTVDAIRDALAWLGKCNRNQAGHSMHLTFLCAVARAPAVAWILEKRQTPSPLVAKGHRQGHKIKFAASDPPACNHQSLNFERSARRGGTLEVRRVSPAFNP